MRATRFSGLVVLAALLVPTLGLAGAPANSVPPAVGFVNYPAPGVMGSAGGEPSLGLDPVTGAAFVQANTRTLHATFDDGARPALAGWRDVSDPMAAPTNFDPILFTDQSTGRTFAGGLELACTVASFTDDGGAHWTPMGNACALPGVDHETLASGPWHEPRPVAATYDRAVYYCVHEAFEMCATSLDGGVTFLPAVPISVALVDPVGVGCGGYTGKLRVAPDGAAYVTSRICTQGGLLGSSTQGVMVTLDNGLTWTSHALPSPTSSPAFEPSVATTTSSWAYAAWTQADNHTYVALSKDHAQHWEAKTDLAALAGLASTTFSTVTAGDDQRAAVAFLGTTTPGDAFASGFTGAWDLYVATTLDAGATWTVTKATSDPVQRGWICTGGINSCTTGAGRNLLDFITAGVDKDGRVLVAYADGCTGGCAAPDGQISSSVSALATIARQACGPSLYAARGDIDGGLACPGAPSAPAVPLHQSGSYSNGPACGLTFDCAVFPVPQGATHVTVAIHDALSPHAGGEWCFDSCSGTIGLFCDNAAVAVPPSVSTIIVVVDASGFGGVSSCALAKTGAGEGIMGTITADYS